MRRDPSVSSSLSPRGGERIDHVTDTFRHPRRLLGLDAVAVELDVPAERHDAPAHGDLDAVGGERNTTLQRSLDLVFELGVGTRRRDHADRVLHRHDARDPTRTFLGGVALIPVADSPLERDDPVAHDDLDRLLVHVGVDAERGRDRCRDVGIARDAEARNADDELVRDALHARDGACDVGGGQELGVARHRAGEGDDAVVDLDADLSGLEAQVTLELVERVPPDLRVALAYFRFHTTTPPRTAGRYGPWRATTVG